MISTTCPNHETSLLQVNDGQMSEHCKQAASALFDMYRQDLCDTREAADTLLQLHRQETNDDTSTGGLPFFNEAEFSVEPAQFDDGSFITDDQLAAIGDLDDEIDFMGLGPDDVTLPAVAVRSDAAPKKAKRARGNPSKDGPRTGKGVRKDVQARIDRLVRAFLEMEANGVVSLVRSTNTRCIFGWSTMTVLDGKQGEFADHVDQCLKSDVWLTGVTNRLNRTKAFYQFIQKRGVVRHGASVALGPEDASLTSAQRKAKKLYSAYLVAATSFTVL